MQFSASTFMTDSAHIYTVKNSFQIAKEIADQDPGFFMASLDIKPIYHNRRYKCLL